MKKIAIVLGGGVNKDGSLPLHVKRRVELAYSLYKNKKIQGIILSGRGTKRKKYKLKITEARAMSEYLLSKGVPKNKLFLEEKSYDTIGNAFFVRTLFLEPKKWYNVIVITSQFHLPRTKKIFQWVLGKKFKVEYKAVSDKGLNKKQLKSRKRVEKILLDFFKREILPQAKNGDKQAIEKYLFTKHPAYCHKFDKAHWELEKKVKKITALY